MFSVKVCQNSRNFSLSAKFLNKIHEIDLTANVLLKDGCTCDLPTKMEALQFSRETKKLTLNKIALPKLKKKDVLIQVAFSGIDSFDVYSIKGGVPCMKQSPVTLGHEFAGQVCAVGDDVSTVQKGDKVAVDPYCGCMFCDACHSGKPQFCLNGRSTSTIGMHIDGGWAPFCAIPVFNVHKLPEKVTMEQAALCETLSSIAHALDVISPVEIGKRILVMGAGIVGRLFLSVLHLQGHRNVTVTETNVLRQKRVQKMGLDVRSALPESLVDKAPSEPAELFDLIIDCCGNPKAVGSALSMLNYGGTLCIYGISPPSAKISLSPFDVYWKELRIVGVLLHSFSFGKGIGLVQSLGDRYLSYEKLGIKVFALKDYAAALEELETGDITKAVFQFK